MNSFARALTGLAALAGAAAIAPVAQAADYSIAGADLSSAYSDDGYYAVKSVAKSAFSDIFTFTTQSGGGADSSVSNLYASLPSKKGVTVTANITGLTLQLETASGSVLATSSYDSVSNTYPLSYANLLANTVYKLVVSGMGTGTNGGTYGLSVGISAVPLPGALVLFGSGIVVLGAAARRKIRSSAR